MKIEYLLFNFVILVGPLFLSLFPIFFVKKPKLNIALISISISALIFLIWDYVVIDYFWSFNENYILGLRIFQIPIEEILFFVTVPYACLFLWENWKRMFPDAKLLKVRSLLIGTMVILLFLSLQLPYTFIVFFVLLLVVILDILLTTKLFYSRRFINFLGIVFLLTLIFNSYLTARPIVLYNGTVKTNINLLTVPIEDFVYGLALISLTVILYEKHSQRK